MLSNQAPPCPVAKEPCFKLETTAGTTLPVSEFSVPLPPSHFYSVNALIVIHHILTRFFTLTVSWKDVDKSTLQTLHSLISQCENWGVVVSDVEETESLFSGFINLLNKFKSIQWVNGFNLL